MTDMPRVRAMAQPGPSWKVFGIGILWGLTAAFAWSGYNVGSRLGRMDGLSAVDMTMLRFGVAALLLAPLVMMGRRGTSLRWVHALWLSVLAGPLFGLLINTGFGLAPLSHAVVLTAGGTMLLANGLAWRLDGKRPQISRLMGMTILIAGLSVIAADQRGQPLQSLRHVLLGDLCFFSGGVLWGIFTYLIGRWKVDPVLGIGYVSLISAAVFLPVFLIWHMPATAMQPGAWLPQVLFQGVLGGCLAPVAIAKTIARVGAGDAALFPALVPSGALVLAIPLLGEYPSWLEVLGIGICTFGLLAALDVTRWFRKTRITRT